MSDKLNINIYRPFGPSVAKVTIPDDIINKLNNYVDDVANNKKKSKELNFGNELAGNVKQEFKLEDDFIEKIGWANFLAKCVSLWIQNTEKKKISKFNLLNSWIVRQFENDYNPLHVHSGHISGVGYLKVPSDFGSYTQEEKKDNTNGRLCLVHGSKMFNSPSQYQIIPKVGDFYFFPNYMMHTVYPFINADKEERRSISFNATIDEGIYHDYASKT